jgi:uncharacterized oligopeptide transporter (OPT) family protein
MQSNRRYFDWSGCSRSAHPHFVCSTNSISVPVWFVSFVLLWCCLMAVADYFTIFGVLCLPFAYVFVFALAPAAFYLYDLCLSLWLRCTCFPAIFMLIFSFMFYKLLATQFKRIIKPRSTPASYSVALMNSKLVGIPARVANCSFCHRSAQPNPRRASRLQHAQASFFSSNR